MRASDTGPLHSGQTARSPEADSWAPRVVGGPHARIERSRAVLGSTVKGTEYLLRLLVDTTLGNEERPINDRERSVFSLRPQIAEA